MGIPTIYRWDDANAPALDSSVGSFVKLLRACLVDGYNLDDEDPALQRSGAGWTEEFADADESVGVFRNSPNDGGTGSFLKVTDAGGTITMSGYEVMDSLDGFTGPIGSVACSRIAYWVLIASDKFFYIFYWSADPVVRVFPSDGYQYFNYFGDFTPVIDQQFNCCIGREYIDIDGVTSLLDQNLSTLSYRGIPSIYTSRLLDGAPTISAKLLEPAKTGVLVSFFETGGSDRSLQVGRDFDGQNLFLTRPLLYDEGVLNSNGVRGFVPGYFIPAHSHTSFDNLEIVNVDGRSFINIGRYNYYNDITKTVTRSSDHLCFNILIEIGRDWG